MDSSIELIVEDVVIFLGLGVYVVAEKNLTLFWLRHRSQWRVVLVLHVCSLVAWENSKVSKVKK